ncbi:MAG: metallophosphoesterase family protein [Nitrososphaerota archaeon]|nr:metallophosphoesterase family protein [Nitrososphaerota archaeon]
MKFVVISDVHANLEALSAVLALARSEDVYCLGDLVDYGAQPNEVIRAVRERGVKCILGNHDRAALTGDTSTFNARAAMSSVWTRKALTEESLRYLRTLAMEMRPELGVGAYFAHGSPDDRLEEYVDPRTHSDLFGHYLDKLKVTVIGLGHTHVPYVWKEHGRVVFNPGSVGQPRDGDWRASFAAVTVEGGRCEAEVTRVEYDVGSASKKILDAGLPSFFAERIRDGV